jgi:hypothetical protein
MAADLTLKGIFKALSDSPISDNLQFFLPDGLREPAPQD